MPPKRGVSTQALSMHEVEMEEIGKLYREDRDVYVVIETDNEVYYFSGGMFAQAMTRFATKGCKLSDIEELIE